MSVVFHLFLLSPVVDNKVSGDAFRRFQGVIILTMPVPSDEIINVRCLSDVLYYLFNNILIDTHSFLFIFLIARGRYALAGAIM